MPGEYVRVGSTAAVLAADACRSSNRTLFGTGISVAKLLHIEKLDKECKTANFHSNVSLSRNISTLLGNRFKGLERGAKPILFPLCVKLHVSGAHFLGSIQ